VGRGDTSTRPDPRARDDVRLVVVDDNESIRLLLRALADRDDRVDVIAEAADADAAVDQVRVHQPHVVLLDLRLPGLDGLDLIPELREASPRSRIILYSAFEGRREDAVAAGAHGWVNKGATWPAIRRAIDDVMAAIPDEP
jgi:DNA-binding NarL/FixJ family response regulator